jgi:hypothetical protein
MVKPIPYSQLVAELLVRMALIESQDKHGRTLLATEYLVTASNGKTYIVRFSEFK